MKLLVATTNTAKVLRVTELLDGLGIEIVRPADVGAAPAIREGSRSLMANARLKAMTWAGATGMPTVATDGGLVVPALGRRWNPVTTARAAGKGTNNERAARLVSLLRGLDGEQRRVHQEEALTLAAADGTLAGVWTTRSSDRYVTEEVDPRGFRDGFWLPAVLLYGPDRRRLWDLPPDEQRLADDQWQQLREALRSAVLELDQHHPDRVAPAAVPGSALARPTGRQGQPPAT